MKRDKLKDMPCWKRAIYITTITVIAISIIVSILAMLELGLFVGLKSYVPLISIINSVLIIIIIIIFYKESKQ